MLQRLTLCFCSDLKHFVCTEFTYLINESSQDPNKSRIRPMVNQRSELGRNNVALVIDPTHFAF